MTSDPRTRPPRPVRVALAAAPPLLADALRSLVAGAAEVTVLLIASDERFDVAITTDDAPRVSADVVIVLDASSLRGGGTVRSGGDRPGACLEDLAAVLRFVREYVPLT